MATRFLITLLTLLASVGPTFAQMSPPEASLNQNAESVDVRISFPGQDRKSVTLEGRRLATGTDLVHLPAAAIERVFRAGRLWDEGERRLQLRLGVHRCTLTADSRLVRIDDEERLLPVPPRALDGDLWVPMTFVVDMLAPLTSELFAWDQDQLHLIVGGVRPNIEGLDVRTAARSTQVRLQCRVPLGWRLEHGADGTLSLKIYGGVVDTRAVRRDQPRGLVQRVNSRQTGDNAEVIVTVSSLVSRTRSHAEDDGRTIVLVLEEEAGTLPDLQVRGEVTMAEPDQLRGERHVEVIVIDPGHGGDDHGVRGRGGIQEDDVVLRVAHDLRDELKDAGFTVVLTREDARGIEPDERAERANLVGGDLFISLHANAWFDSRIQGFEAWFLEAAGGVDQDPTAFVPWTLVQQQHLAGSADLAEHVTTRVAEQFDIPVRGVGQADLPWLMGVDMPAVVLELGYLTNGDDTDRLEDRRDRRRLAAAIAAAVKDIAAYSASLGGER